MNRSILVVAAGILVVGASAAMGAGFFNGFPQAGTTAYPTLPLTGNETIPADTNLTQGLTPETELITPGILEGYGTSQANSAGFRSALIDGDFGLGLWQRGAGPSADIAATTTYFADGWWNKGTAGSAIDVTKETGAADITPTFLASDRFQRKSGNTDVNPVCTGQVISSQNSTRFQGQTAEFAVVMQSGANFSAASKNVVMTIGYSVAGSADQSADTFVGTPGSLGTWTGQVNTSQTVAINATLSRYSVVAAIPATATQVGVELCFTPVGTAGTNDWVEFTGARLQVNPNAIAQTGAANATFSVGSFEHIPANVEALREQAYYYQFNETNGIYVAAGMTSATNVERAVFPLPVQMRATPTCTFTAGGLKWNLAGTNTAVGTLTEVTGSTSQYVTIGDTVTSTAGGAAFLNGSNTTGAIKCTAEL